MENEETNTAPELKTEEGVYTEEISSTVIPQLTDIEADEREPEKLDSDEEEGK